MYPGAMTILIPRLLCALFAFLGLTICIKIIMIGVDRSKREPIVGLRKSLLRIACLIFVNIFALGSNFSYLTYE